MSRAVLLNAGLSNASSMTDSNGYVINRTAIVAQLALQLPNSRTAETEADQIDFDLAVRAGYDPKAAVNL